MYNKKLHHLVLFQVSTRILLGVISPLVISSIVVFVFVDTSSVLPRLIGIIAAVVSLLASSRLVDQRTGLVPPGSEWMTDSEMKLQQIWEGDRFKTDWRVDDADFWGQSRTNTNCEAHCGVGQGVGYFRIDMRPRNGAPPQMTCLARRARAVVVSKSLIQPEGG